MTVTVFLVDDHPMILHGLRGLLDAKPDFKVVGEASDGIEAIQKIKLTKPDILVIDMMMPNLNGLEVIRQIRRSSPGTRVIVFSMQSAEPYVLDALQTGAEGYILKDTGPAELIIAINSVTRGERFLSKQLSDRLDKLGPKAAKLELDLYQTLTMREREILQMTAEGKSSTEIGEKIMISPRTVEVHRSHFMKKLGLQNQAELIRYALKRGILPMDD